MLELDVLSVTPPQVSSTKPKETRAQEPEASVQTLESVEIAPQARREAAELLFREISLYEYPTERPVVRQSEFDQRTIGQKLKGLIGARSNGHVPREVQEITQPQSEYLEKLRSITSEPFLLHSAIQDLHGSFQWIMGSIDAIESGNEERVLNILGAVESRIAHPTKILFAEKFQPSFLPEGQECLLAILQCQKSLEEVWESIRKVLTDKTSDTREEGVDAAKSKIQSAWPEINGKIDLLCDKISQFSLLIKLPSSKDIERVA